MPHTAPDWSWGKATTIYEVYKGLGEQAARLWSPNTFDRRGNIIWMDSFEAGHTKWRLNFALGGGAAGLTVARVAFGGYSVFLTTGVLAPRNAWMDTEFSFPRLSKLGFESKLNIPVGLERVEINYTLHDGVDSWLYALQYNRGARTLSVWNAPGAWVVINPNILMVVGTTIFQMFKLVGDMIIKQYVRAIVNEREYDLRAYAPQQGVSFLEPRILASIYCYGTAVANFTTYVDCVIFTQNEP